MAALGKSSHWLLVVRSPPRATTANRSQATIRHNYARLSAIDPLQTLAILALLPPKIAMDELKFFGGLAAITTFVIALLIYFGRKLSKAVERNAEFIDLPLYVTRSGTAFFASVVAFWVYCAAVRVRHPHSALGEYLGTFDGIAAVILGSIMFVAIAWVVSEKLGYPFAKWGNESESD